MRARLAGSLLAGLALLPSIAAAYPAGLPAEAAARLALRDAPVVRVAQESAARTQAHGAQLRAGPYEWTMAAAQQRRTDPSGLVYSEQTYEISRGLRWMGKRGIDHSIGDQAERVGQLSYADAWHEAARSLLAGWFDWLRALRTVEVLTAQTANLQEQLHAIERRVELGELRSLDRDLARADLERALAGLSAAEMRRSETELRLQGSFPDLALVAPARTEPEALSGSADEWVHSILADNHEIELAQARAEEARLGAERAGRDRIPDPTVGVRYSHNFDGNRRVVGITLSLPLGGPARAAASRGARAEARMLEQRSQETTLRVTAEARRAFLAVAASREQWLRQRQAAEQARNNAERLGRGYGLGEFTIAEVLLARRQALESELDAALTQLDALEAIGRLYLDSHRIWTAPEPGGRPSVTG